MLQFTTSAIGAPVVNYFDGLIKLKQLVANLVSSYLSHSLSHPIYVYVYACCHTSENSVREYILGTTKCISPLNLYIYVHHPLFRPTQTSTLFVCSSSTRLMLITLPVQNRGSDCLCSLFTTIGKRDVGFLGWSL